MKVNLGLVCLSALLYSALSGTAGAVEMELVPVGNPGNPPDQRYDPEGFGAVPYSYSIAKYEVTNREYREFLNAKATLGDPHSLYHEMMGQSYGGIAREGSGTVDDPFVYLSKPPLVGDRNWDNAPVNFVGVWDAARFVNWLNNGQGDADTEGGAYTGVGIVPEFRRVPGAQYYLPTENEWYKAAYYDPLKADNGGPYWEYPTRTNSKPPSDPAPGGDLENGSANYGTFRLETVGAFTAKPSTSAYSTFDQGGNVWEWNETLVIGNFFGLRGGSFYDVYGLEAGHRNSYPALFQNAMIGFRVVAVPEPASATLLAISGIVFLGCWIRCRAVAGRAAKANHCVNVRCSMEENFHA